MIFSRIVNLVYLWPKTKTSFRKTCFWRRRNWWLGKKEGR